MREQVDRFDGAFVAAASICLEMIRRLETTSTLTRLLEIVVHTDDLAVSVDVLTPQFPDEVFAPVRDLLVRLAVGRHGQSAIVSSLARRERSRVISAF